MKQMQLLETTPVVTNTDIQIVVTEETDVDELSDWLKHGDFEGWLRLTTKEIPLGHIMSSNQSQSTAAGKCWVSWLLLMVISQSLPNTNGSLRASSEEGAR